MSTDINIYAEIKDDRGRWVDVTSAMGPLDGWTHHETFRLLGYGHWSIGDDKIPIERGLPEDVSASIFEAHRDFEGHADGEGHVTLQTLLEHPWWTGPVEYCSIKLDAYMQKKRDPEDFHPYPDPWEPEVDTEISPKCADQIIAEGSKIPFDNIWVRVRRLNRLKDQHEHFYGAILQGQLIAYSVANNINSNNMRIVFWFDS